MSFLLDTNVISELRKGARATDSVLRWADSVSRRDLFTSVLVIGELRRGVERKRRHDRPQADILERWLMTVIENFRDRILPIDGPITTAWGLMGIRDPLPVIDSLLAATAKVHDLILVTRDKADFASVGITVLDPFEA